MPPITTQSQDLLASSSSTVAAAVPSGRTMRQPGGCHLGTAEFAASCRRQVRAFLDALAAAFPDKVIDAEQA